MEELGRSQATGPGRSGNRWELGFYSIQHVLLRVLVGELGDLIPAFDGTLTPSGKLVNKQILIYFCFFFF